MNLTGNSEGRPPRQPGDSGKLAGLYKNDAPRPCDWEGVEQWVAGVLRRAHQAAEATAGPQELRGILYLAQCFADEIAEANPRFDRLSFITAVTKGPS